MLYRLQTIERNMNLIPIYLMVNKLDDRAPKYWKCRRIARRCRSFSSPNWFCWSFAYVAVAIVTMSPSPCPANWKRFRDRWLKAIFKPSIAIDSFIVLILLWLLYSILMYYNWFVLIDNCDYWCARDQQRVLGAQFVEGFQDIAFHSKNFSLGQLKLIGNNNSLNSLISFHWF